MNILDYLDREFSSFDSKSFNDIDSVILSQFCMVRCEGLVSPFEPYTKPSRIQKYLQALQSIIKRGSAHKADSAQKGSPIIKGGAALKSSSFLKGGSIRTLEHSNAHFGDLLRTERYSEMFTGLVPDRIKATLVALASNPRFRTLTLHDYISVFDERKENQFAAITFTYKDQFSYIGFRGTDTSITGWKENFNMACTSPVPAQTQALHYLEGVAPKLPDKIYLGGHSKGGNLALYAALKASPEIQDRIVTVFDHDGPGFKKGAISNSEWDAVKGKVRRTIPNESIVGMLMFCPIEPTIVQAQEHGFDQHSVFNWDVNSTMDGFIQADKLNDSAQFFDEVFTEWLSQYSDKEATAIVNALFKAIEVSGITNATEVFFSGIKIIPFISKGAQNIDSESGEILRNALGSLASIAANHAGTNVIRAFSRGSAHV